MMVQFSTFLDQCFRNAKVYHIWDFLFIGGTDRCCVVNMVLKLPTSITLPVLYS